MNKDFQKEIINKIHKDKRDLEKKIVEQESSIQGMGHNFLRIMHAQKGVYVLNMLKDSVI